MGELTATATRLRVPCLVGLNRISFTSTSFGWFIDESDGPREKVGSNGDVFIELSNSCALVNRVVSSGPTKLGRSRCNRIAPRPSREVTSPARACTDISRAY